MINRKLWKTKKQWRKLYAESLKDLSTLKLLFWYDEASVFVWGDDMREMIITEARKRQK